MAFPKPKKHISLFEQSTKLRVLAMRSNLPDTFSQMNAFSPHLFWDTKPENVDIEKHRIWLVKRVLEKGLWADWKLLLILLGKEKVRDAVKNARHLEHRARSFACVSLDLDPKELRCSTLKSFQSTHWPY